MDFVIGGLAASGASLFSNPFDVLKTRMQLQGELRAKGAHAVYYKNVFHAGYVVAKNEGLRGLQKGLSAALIMHSVRNSVRLGTYQWLNKRGFLTDNEGRTIMYKSALGSAFSGAAGAFLGSPLFLIKTQLQAQAAKEIAVGHQHDHTGAFQALRNIYIHHGVSNKIIYYVFSYMLIYTYIYRYLDCGVVLVVPWLEPLWDLLPNLQHSP